MCVMTILDDCFLSNSGEPTAFRLHETAHDVDLHSHAGSEGCDAGRPLRELPRAVHLADIATRPARERVPIDLKSLFFFQNYWLEKQL